MIINAVQSKRIKAMSFKSKRKDMLAQANPMEEIRLKVLGNARESPIFTNKESMSAKIWVSSNVINIPFKVAFFARLLKTS